MICKPDSKARLQERHSSTRANTVHLLEDLHHEAVAPVHHLCCSALFQVLRSDSGITHGQGWRRLLGAGCFYLPAERWGHGKQPRRCRAVLHDQIQSSEGNRHRRWCKPVEGPAGAAQRATPLQAESRRKQPGRRAQRCWTGPDHTHPQEGHHEVHGGTSVSAMLGGVGQFALLLKEAKQRIAVKWPHTQLQTNPKMCVSIEKSLESWK